MTNEDPRAILDRAPMGRTQVLAVALCVLFNALDGFDVLSISFASPGIAKDWGIPRDALGIVLSMELIGMAIGSIGLGTLCDRVGRRPMVIGCLVAMASGMALASRAENVQTLSLFRLFTGIGIGGMLAATNAVVAEFSSRTAKNLSVALMAAGYPAGAVVGGSIASALLVNNSWRVVFELGAIASGVSIALAWLLLPETLPWLIQRRPANALGRINAVLVKMGHGTIEALPDVDAASARGGIARLFRHGLAPITLMLTLAYCAHIITFYFILKWAPKIVADMGFPPSAAGGVLVWANFGGMTGAILLSLLSRRANVRLLTIGAMIGSALLVAAFGRSAHVLSQLSLLAAIAGFCTNGAVVGLYAIFAQSFPTEVRAGGTGFVIGFGRGGAVLSPIIAGYLFAGGMALPSVALVMGIGSAVAAVLLVLVRYEEPPLAVYDKKDARSGSAPGVEGFEAIRT